VTTADVKGSAIPDGAAPRRGRPRQTAAEAEAVRARIVAATAQVFAERGHHGLTVGLILEVAGIARPTFYRYFANADEPLHVLLNESDRALVTGLQVAIDEADNEVTMVVAGIDAYLQWARDRGPVLRPLYAELHDPSSPVSQHRVHTLDVLRARLIAGFDNLGRTPPPSIDLDVLLHVFEYVGFRVVLADPDDDAAVAWGRATMARVALAILATPDNMQAAMTLPDLLARDASDARDPDQADQAGQAS
jgi:TetR/AcrR family transcriptional regulator